MALRRAAILKLLQSIHGLARLCKKSYETVQGAIDP